MNRAFASKFFPGESAIGKRITPGATADRLGALAREIVGIAGNLRQAALKLDEEPVYYLPYRQMPWCCPSVVMRTGTAPMALAPLIRSSVVELDPELPVQDFRTLDEILYTRRNPL